MCWDWIRLVKAEKEREMNQRYLEEERTFPDSFNKNWDLKVIKVFAQLCVTESYLQIVYSIIFASSAIYGL